jgi:hypothetical protein
MQLLSSTAVLPRPDHNAYRPDYTGHKFNPLLDLRETWTFFAVRIANKGCSGKITGSKTETADT